MRLLHIFTAGAKTPWQTRFSFLRRLLPQAGVDALDSSIYRFIMHDSLRDQMYLVVVTLLSFPFLYGTLQIPKYIVDTIAGKTSSRELFDLNIAQIPYLLLLCGAFLAFILINGWFKLHINVKKGQVGERPPPAALPALRARVAVSAQPFRSNGERRDHCDDYGRVGAGQRLHR